jgi:hypothetical protein
VCFSDNLTVCFLSTAGRQKESQPKRPAEQQPEIHSPPWEHIVAPWPISNQSDKICCLSRKFIASICDRIDLNLRPAKMAADFTGNIAQ